MSTSLPSVQGQVAVNQEVLTSERLVGLWLRGKSRNTVDAYRRDVEDFLEHCDAPLHEVKLHHIWEWTDSLDARELSPATVARKLAAVKSLFSFGHRTGYLPFNVGAAVRLPHVPDLLAERILAEEETLKLLSFAANDRDAMILRLFYSSGARVSELVTLTWGSVMERLLGGTTTGQVTLVGKGTKSRSVLLSAATWRQLSAFRELERGKGYGGPDDPVFRSSHGGALTRQTIWLAVKKAARAAGLPAAVSPHWLRHAHASHALDRGAPTHLVKETLGHKSLATTSRYTHARPDDSSGKYLPV